MIFRSPERGLEEERAEAALHGGLNVES